VLIDVCSGSVTNGGRLPTETCCVDCLDDQPPSKKNALADKRVEGSEAASFLSGSEKELKVANFRSNFSDTPDSRANRAWMMNVLRDRALKRDDIAVRSK